MTYFLCCDTRSKFAAGRRRSIAGAIYRFNNRRQGSSTPVWQDKQMPNTGSAQLDAMTEPAIAGERRSR
jgi:hypothetical protein